MYKTLSAPHIIQIEVSAMCTNCCQHCYNFWRQGGDGQTTSANLSLEQVSRIMDQIIGHRVFHLVLTGGEPLLNKKALFEILRRATENNITTSVNSTLVTLTKEDALKFKELGVSMVLTSLLGPTAEIHDQIVQRNTAFERTVKGIRVLQEAKVPVSANMVVSRKNQHLIRETGNLARSLRLKSFNSTRAGCPGNCFNFSEFSLNLQEFRLYLEKLHTFGDTEKMPVDVLSSYPLCGIKEVDRYQKFASRRCMAGVNTLTLSVTGEVRPCSHFDVSYGNLLQEDLSVIWQKMTEWRDGSLIPAVCQSCKVLPWCGGGCRMEAKMRNGSPSGLDPYASPSDADYVFGQLKGRRKESSSLPVTVRLNPKIRWRLEDFGAAIFAGTRFACYLNHKGLELIKSLSHGLDLSTADLIKRSGTGEAFMAGLIERKVFVPNNPKEKEGGD